MHAGRNALIAILSRVQHLHDERRADPAMSAALARLGAWQSERLGHTYADLSAQRRYRDAIAFFQSDLYGGSDFSQRDADFARVVQIMIHMLPARGLEAVTRAMELNALSQELDRGLIGFLPRADRTFTVAQYCDAFRATGRRADRDRQVQLVVDVGTALDALVRKPLMHAALRTMRAPARLAGLSALQDFLERGFAAFHDMHGSTEFLATIAARETTLCERIFAGDSAPFPDPNDG